MDAAKTPGLLIAILTRAGTVSHYGQPKVITRARCELVRSPADPIETPCKLPVWQGVPSIKRRHYMSISSIGSVSAVAQSTRLASDGDTAAVESRESSATKKAEKLNNGVQPKPTLTQSVPVTAGGLSRIA